MLDQKLSEADFKISTAAKDEIATLRALWDQKFADRADAVAIAWGTTVLHSGERSDSVVVSFYGRSERPHVEAAIEHAFGLDIVFFVIERDQARFLGKTLDFVEGHGLQLRS